jgi:serine/threonine protein kinase
MTQSDSNPDPLIARRIDGLCDEFERSCKSGRPARIEDLLNHVGETHRPVLLRELILLEQELTAGHPDQPVQADYRRRFAAYTGMLDELFSNASEAVSTIDTEPPDPSLLYLECRDGVELSPPLHTAGWSLSSGELGIGAILGSRYLLKTELGRGGMGVVFQARDTRLDRTVAIKILPGENSQNLARQHQLEELFFAEARLGAGLLHPTIATVFDFGSHCGRPYCVFEYLDGETLEATLRRRTRLPLEDVRLIIGPLAQALDYAHARHVVHRDLKPTNIRATAQGQYKILDFGLAKRFNYERDWRFAGTPAYAAPEQAAGHPSDGRADQYALGLIAFELITGRRPFNERDPIALLRLHREHQPPSPQEFVHGLPEEICAAILKTLKKSPDERFRLCEEFATSMGCRLLSAAAEKSQILLRTTGRLTGYQYSFGRIRLPSAILALTSEALWIWSDGLIERWPVAAVAEFREHSKWGYPTLVLTMLQEQRHVTKQFRLNRQECRKWLDLFQTLLDTTTPNQRRPEPQPQRPPVVLVQQRPNASYQLLGPVEVTGCNKAEGSGFLELQAALVGADAVIEFQAEQLIDPRVASWRFKGQAVKSVDRQSLVELRLRWYSDEISRITKWMFFLLLICFICALLGTCSGQVGITGMETRSRWFGLTAWLGIAVGTLLFPLILAVLLRSLKWPQLIGPSAFFWPTWGVVQLLSPVLGPAIAIACADSDWHPDPALLIPGLGLLCILFLSFPLIYYSFLIGKRLRRAGTRIRQLWTDTPNMHGPPNRKRRAVELGCWCLSIAQLTTVFALYSLPFNKFLGLLNGSAFREAADREIRFQKASNTIDDTFESWRKDGRSEEARRQLEEVIPLLQSIVDDDAPGRMGQRIVYQDRLAAAYAILGLVYLDLNQDAEALQYIRRASALRDELIRNNPSFPELYPPAIAVHRKALELYVKAGKEGRAKEEYTAAERLSEEHNRLQEKKK